MTPIVNNYIDLQSFATRDHKIPDAQVINEIWDYDIIIQWQTK
jgi:hypothetical protein